MKFNSTSWMSMSSYPKSFFRYCVWGSFVLAVAMGLLAWPGIARLYTHPSPRFTEYGYSVTAIAIDMALIMFQSIILNAATLILRKKGRSAWKWTSIASMTMLVLVFSFIMLISINEVVIWWEEIVLFSIYLIVFFILIIWYLNWLIMVYYMEKIRVLSKESLLSLAAGFALAVVPPLILVYVI